MIRKAPSKHIQLLNERGECITLLARKFHDARRAMEAAERIYYDVLDGTCYRCLGNGDVAGGDFSPNTPCPVCRGTKRWPEVPDSQEEVPL